MNELAGGRSGSSEEEKRSSVALEVNRLSQQLAELEAAEASASQPAELPEADTDHVLMLYPFTPPAGTRTGQHEHLRLCKNDVVRASPLHARQISGD